MTYSNAEDNAEKPNYKGKNKSDKNSQKTGKREFKPPKKISEKYLYNSGLAYLQRFPASTHHFKTIMMRKIQKSCRHHTSQDIEQCEKWLDALIQQFQELELLNDEAYLKGMITSYRRRGLSSMQIKLKLGQKGFDHDTIQKEVNHYDTEEFNTDRHGDFYAALTFTRKKRIGIYDKENKKTFEKALAMMARAGYSYDIAKKALEISDEELDEINCL